MLCGNCGGFTERPKYCSSSCAAIVNNKAANRKRRQPEGSCTDCKIVIHKRLSRCSDCRAKRTLCSAERKRKQNIANVSDWRRRLKKRAVEYKGGSCISCGYNRCLRALQFHHRDPNKKDFQIAGRLRSWNNVLIEINKCDLVCSNCHAEIHDSSLVQLAGRDTVNIDGLSSNLRAGANLLSEQN